jgi:flagellar basal body-associated protein FliL
MKKDRNQDEVMTVDALIKLRDEIDAKIEEILKPEALRNERA